MKLDKRIKTALENLESECNYEDGRMNDQDTFIIKAKLGPGVGDKTLAALVQEGLITKGTNRWFDEVGYRITDLGRQVLRDTYRM